MWKSRKKKGTKILFTILFGISVIGAQPLERMDLLAPKSPGKIVLTMLEPQFSLESSPKRSAQNTEPSEESKSTLGTFADKDRENSLPQITVASDGNPTEKVLYLTFDDGPLKGTENVLNVLKEEKIPATMFCIGRHARLHPELFRQELSMPDLLIANHTYSHANGHYSRFYSDTFGVLSDVEHAQIVLGGRKYLRLAGRNVWRLPEISRNDQAIVALRGSREVPKYDALSQEGYFIYGWDVEWHFDRRSGRPVENPELLAARIDALYRHGRMVRHGKVVLLAHDFMFRSRRSTAKLRRFIRLMKRRGWHFKTLRHYSRYTPEPLYMAKYHGKKRKTVIASVAESAPSPTPHRIRHRVIHSSASSSLSTLSAEAMLTDAVRHYDALDVDRLLRQGASVNRIDEFGRTALNTAVRANSLVLVKKLLAQGADLNKKDGSGITPLQMARRFKRKAIETYLIHYARAHALSLHPNSQKRSRRNTPIAIAQPTRIDPLKILGQANGSTPFN